MGATALPLAADRPERDRSRSWRALASVPPLVWIVAFGLLPNLFLLFNSLWVSNVGTVEHTWTLDNYHDAVSSHVVRTLFWRTLSVSLAVAVLATAIAYPSAYFIVRRFRRHRLTAALLVLVPLWIGLLMRVFAWRIILGRDGVLSGLLQTLGLTDHPTSALLNTSKAVILALTYVAIPYVFIIAFTTLERIPPALLEASADCGANAWRAFRTVAWPLSRSSVAIGFAMAFVIAFSDYVTPQLVGGFNGTMLGSIVIQDVGLSANFPAASTIAMCILVVTSMVLLLVTLVGRTEARFE
jgi:spermidine/putrescine transport system permease protein